MYGNTWERRKTDAVELRVIPDPTYVPPFEVNPANPQCFIVRGQRCQRLTSMRPCPSGAGLCSVKAPLTCTLPPQDFRSGGVSLGRVVIELKEDVCPMCAACASA